MKVFGTLVLLSVSLSLTACDAPKKRPGINPSLQTEKENTEERNELLNAVQEHPSLQDPSAASEPVYIPTTIPPPAEGGGMAGHSHSMDMNEQAPEQANQEAPPPSQ